MALALEVLWFDDHVIEVRVRCDNGRFAGTADCYAGHGAFGELAAAVCGFPATANDRRMFALGAFESSSAGGGFQIVLRCVGPAGHAVAEVRVRSPGDDCAGGLDESCDLSFPVEAAAVDDFVAALGGMDVAVGEAVRLGPAT